MLGWRNTWQKRTRQWNDTVAAVCAARYASKPKASLCQGIVLTAFGVLAIGLVDNILRPILVGEDTRMPDYLILISTLDGLALLGLNGFVIGPLVAALFVASWICSGRRARHSGCPSRKDNHGCGGFSLHISGSSPSTTRRMRSLSKKGTSGQ